MPITMIRVRAPIRFEDGWEMQRLHGAELEGSKERAAKLILLQHTPVYTLGRKTESEHLPVNERDLSVRTGADVVRIDRGGSVTYHGPGQLTAYLLLNLRGWGMGIHEHLDKLEESAIRAIGSFGLAGRRIPGMTGVWVGGENPGKICAIGVSASRWVTYHGLALNVDLDLAPFAEVIPCGLTGRPVTTLAREVGKPVCMSDAEDALAAAVRDVYGEPLEKGMV